MLLAITVLSATFIGLVAVLLFYGYSNSSGSVEANRSKLLEWIAEHGVSLPSISSVIAALNESASSVAVRRSSRGQVSYNS